MRPYAPTGPQTPGPQATVVTACGGGKPPDRDCRNRGAHGDSAWRPHPVFPAARLDQPASILYRQLRASLRAQPAQFHGDGAPFPAMELQPFADGGLSGGNADRTDGRCGRAVVVALERLRFARIARARRRALQAVRDRPDRLRSALDGLVGVLARIRLAGDGSL